MTDAPYTIQPARYAKGMMLVRTSDGSGYKTRAARLIGDGLRCRYTGREGGYVASPSKVRRFEKLYAEGWDASSFSGKLEPPRPEPAARDAGALDAGS